MDAVSPTPAATHPALDAAGALRMAVFRFSRRLRTERADDALSDGQLAVLSALYVHGPHTLGDLADRERVTAPSMNRTVNCLERLGYVFRSPDPGDGRKVIVDVSTAGQEVIEETRRRRDAWLEAVLASLDADDREVLARAAEIMQREAAR